MRTLVNCQPLKPLESDTSVIRSDSHQSRHRRRLNAAYDSDADDDAVHDARWLLMGAAAAAVGLTSLISVFALCTCCPPYRTRRCVGHKSLSPLGRLSICAVLLIDFYFYSSYSKSWRGGATGKAFGLAISRSRVQILLEVTLRNNLRQVVYTYVPLSPSSITWYRPKGGDALRLGR